MMHSNDRSLSIQEKEFQKIQQKKEKKRPVLLNCIKAFFVGGFICFIGQCISTFYIYFFDFTEQTAGNPTIATIIFITMLLTGFGVYDHIGQFAGVGTAVPFPGFAIFFIFSVFGLLHEGFVFGLGTSI